jgi:hypothetical protein
MGNPLENHRTELLTSRDRPTPYGGTCCSNRIVRLHVGRAGVGGNCKSRRRTLLQGNELTTPASVLYKFVPNRCGWYLEPAEAPAGGGAALQTASHGADRHVTVPEDGMFIAPPVGDCLKILMTNPSEVLQPGGVHITIRELGTSLARQTMIARSSINRGSQPVRETVDASKLLETNRN